MRPAYLPTTPLAVGEQLLWTDPWARDLSGAIENVYRQGAPALLSDFQRRLAKARGLTS